MIQHSTFPAVPAHAAPGHGRDTITQSTAGGSSVRPLLLTMVTTLMLAMVLIVLTATSLDISALDAGTLFPA